MPVRPLYFVPATLLVAAAPLFGAVEAANPGFEVFPEEVNLKFMRDRQSMVVRITEANGVHRDVTSEVKFSVVDPTKAKVDNATVTPLADGQTAVKIEYQGKAMEIPVKVEEAKVDPAISFKADVMPVFLKAGCNSGGCHGSARGKDGFMLSLFGYDPDGDHFRITRQMVGRRINLAVPEESMLITKNIGTAPHTGGKLFPKESELCQTLIRWLEAGAPNDEPGKEPVCTEL